MKKKDIPIQFRCKVTIFCPLSHIISTKMTVYNQKQRILILLAGKKHRSSFTFLQNVYKKIRVIRVQIFV